MTCPTCNGRGTNVALQGLIRCVTCGGAGTVSSTSEDAAPIVHAPTGEIKGAPSDHQWPEGTR